MVLPIRAIRTLGPWVLSALLLAACSGGDPDVPGSGSPSGAPTTQGAFTAGVSFGDSLSDVGAYTPATSVTANGVAPYIGGKFTTNSATGTVWVETLATSLGLLVTPAEVGFAGTSAMCPAAANPALAGTCTGYGQGGSRVTNPDGIGHAGGALTVPMVTQISNHLARFGGFKSSDLILVYGANNDGFAQFGAFIAAAAQIQADAVAGKLTPDRANGAGSLAFLGDDILSAKVVAPTVLVNYHFFEPGSTWRPYVGAGLNCTQFTSIQSSLSSDVQMGDSFGLALQAGIAYALTKEFGLYASIAGAQVKSKVVSSGSTVLTTTIDFRPIIYSIGASCAF